MSIAQSLLPQFDFEMANTRKTLERVPMEKADWKPHPKSGTLGWLAGHVATLPMLAKVSIDTEALDFTTSPRPPQPKTRQELLSVFDQLIQGARTAIAGASDQHLLQPWTLRGGERVIFTLPRIAVLQGAFLSHLIHHRGQLTVYLRLNDIPVPALYGPSADEQ